MFNCPRCGATLADGSQSCPYCGTAFNAQPTNPQPTNVQPTYQQPMYPNYGMPQLVPPVSTGGLVAWAISTTKTWCLVGTILGVLALIGSIAQAALS